MPEIIDHLGRKVQIKENPQRIISLVPAITETLFELGLGDKIIGRTRFCKFPVDKVKSAVNIGGTKEIKLDRIHELKPDLIIAEKEENTKEIVELLEQYYPVFVFEIQHIEDVYRMIQDAGKITAHQVEANTMEASIRTAFETLPKAQNKRIAYVIWQKPYMVVGKETYIQTLLNEMGFINPFVTKEGRYPVVTEGDLLEANLDEIFLATEPFPFREKHLAEFQEMLPQVKPRIVDGEMFWYGAKMVEAAAYFKKEFQD